MAATGQLPGKQFWKEHRYFKATKATIGLAPVLIFGNLILRALLSGPIGVLCEGTIKNQP